MNDIIPCKWDSATRSYYPVLGATCTTYQATTEREKALEAQVAEWQRCYDRAQRLRAATEAQVAGLSEALRSIKNMKAEPIGDSGFVHGPRLLFDNCQRIARDALRAALANCPAPADAQGVEPVAWREAAHALNELCDGATSAIEWLRNVKDGISTVDDALAAVRAEWKRVEPLAQKAGSDLRALTAPPPDQARREALAIANAALLSIALMDCYTRDGEDPAHLLMMRLAREAIDRISVTLASPPPAAAQKCERCSGSGLVLRGGGDIRYASRVDRCPVCSPAPAAAQKGDEP